MHKLSMSCSSSKQHWTHDVFLSFRGWDTRWGFISHLYTALKRVGITTYVDEKIEKGEALWPAISRAIEGSKISIVILSRNYATSRWCLSELEKIMQCRETTGQLVVPIFYDVHPRDVRHQRGDFGLCFEELAAKFSGLEETHTVFAWRNALTRIADLSGWHLERSRSESEIVDAIVGDVFEKLDISYLQFTDYPVGLESRVQDVIQFLESTSSTGVRMVGIWEWEGVKKLKIHSIEWGKSIIKERFCSKRALLVFDDVDNLEQINILCGTRIRNWIGSGSVIIVTARYLRLLNVLKVDHIKKMTEMDQKESLELFNWHAFKEERPREDFIELSKSVVAYCGGLPLALEVLGSYLYERAHLEWMSVLSKLEVIPNGEVQKKLRISFDGLRDDMEKDIFLDICCFFIGKNRAYVTQILNGCGLRADIGITLLIERSLIKVEKGNKLGMHALLRDMGREIVRQSSPKEPGERCRLWFHTDVLDVLTQNTGTKAIEGLPLKLRRSGISFDADAVLKMKTLRLLQLDNVHLNGEYGYLSKHLKWVSWRGFPLKHMPDNFDQRNVVVFDLKHSNLKLVWKAPKMLEWLKILNLSHSRYLTETPDFSNLPNLEELILKDCPSLTEVHQSIGDLSKILLINLKDCTSLGNLPRVTYKLKTLKTLILSGCSKIDKLEEDIEQMESLTTLTAENTAIKQVPFSIVRSESIGYISLSGYEGLARHVFPSLIWSWTSPTTYPLSYIHPFGSMPSSLVSLNVQNIGSSNLPILSDLSKLRCLWVQCSSEFQLTQDLGRILDDVYGVNIKQLETTSPALEISEHSLRSLLIGMGNHQQVFDTLSKSISQELITSKSH